MNTSKLTITKVEIYKAEIRLKHPFVISLGPILASENLFVKIHTNVGVSGVGECSPYVYIVGETQETCFAVAMSIAKLIQGKNPLHRTSISSTINSAFKGNNSVKSAFDMALYDLAAKLADLPLYVYLGGLSEKKIHTDQTIGIMDLESTVKKAQEINATKVPAIKIKLGTTVKEDIERVRAVRENTCEQTQLRVDANQGWDYTDALKVLNAIVAYDVEHCEEPVPSWNTHDLARISQKSPIPIMADESLFDHYDAIRLIRSDACHRFNIKLAKSGGIYQTLKIIHIAEACGVPCQLGAMGESRLGMTAAAHLGKVSNIIQYFDLDPPFMQVDDPIMGGISYGDHGEVIIPESPGLGADLDPAFFDSLEKIIV